MSSIGAAAEQAVARYLTDRSWKVVAQNWTNHRAEIDIIYIDNSNRIHFVEVKYRRDDAYGGGLAAINIKKQRQLIRGALWWLQENSQSEAAWQIDVADVTGSAPDFEINLLENVVTA